MMFQLLPLIICLTCPDLVVVGMTIDAKTMDPPVEVKQLVIKHEPPVAAAATATVETVDPPVVEVSQLITADPLAEVKQLKRELFRGQQQPQGGYAFPSQPQKQYQQQQQQQYHPPQPQQQQYQKPSQNNVVDFTGATRDPETGRLCVMRDSETTSTQKDATLECTHKQVRMCHYTYVTKFSPLQEEVCEENFEKLCQITFKKEAFNETVKKCYKELDTVCQDGGGDQPSYNAPSYQQGGGGGGNSISGGFGGDGELTCQTYHETACSTRYEEKRPGHFVGKTDCEKIPRKLCGTSNCKVVERPETCHDKQVAAVVDVPEESCDLNPQKNCRLQTRLVPRLTPEEECTLQPREVCQLGFSGAKKTKRPLKVKLCLQEEEGGGGGGQASYNAPSGGGAYSAPSGGGGQQSAFPVTQPSVFYQPALTSSSELYSTNNYLIQP